MKRRHLREFASVCLALLVFCGPARADLIEFTFAGEIEIAAGDIPAPWDGVEVGSPWEVRYVFDSEAEDSDDSPWFGEYEMLYAEVTVAGETLFTDEGHIDVDYLNQRLFYIFDDLAIGENGAAGDVEVIGISDFLEDDSLPTEIDFENVFTSFLEVGNSNENWGIFGTTLSFSSQVIPSPLTGLPLLAVFALRPRRCR